MTTNSALKQLLQAALVCALMIILGLFPGIPLGIIPVAVVLQNLGVMLAGELLCPRYAFAAVGVFLLLVALGLPFLSGGRGGLANLLGPSGGYFIGWLVAPPVNAWLLAKTQAGKRRVGYELALAFACLVLGIDLAGALWLAWQSHMALGLALLSNLAFLPGDALKLGLAVTIARRLRRVGTVASQ
jgi:biotin transport system substrate-specific component